MHEKNFKQVQIETQKILEELSNKEKESHLGNEETKTLSLSHLIKHQ